MKTHLAGAVGALVMTSLVAFAEDNVPFKVEKHGSGRQAVVLIPGLDCGAWVWEGAIQALKADCTLYALTLAGFDGVPPVKSPFCDTWAQAIAGLIQKEKLEKPILVGHSLGGVLALRVGIAHSDLLGGIILVDGGPMYPPLRQGETMEAHRAQMDLFIKGIRASTPEQWEAGFRMYLSTAVTRKEDLDLILGRCVKADRDTHCGAFYELGTNDLRPDLPKVQVPVLALVAVAPGAVAADARAFFEQGLKGLPRLDIETIADAHHFVMYDQPERLQAALKAGLARMK